MSEELISPFKEMGDEELFGRIGRAWVQLQEEFKDVGKFNFAILISDGVSYRVFEAPSAHSMPLPEDKKRLCEYWSGLFRKVAEDFDNWKTGFERRN